MPVTIGTLTSTVTVAKGRRGSSHDQLEELTRLVAERLRRESESEEEDRIPERMSES